MSSHSLERGEEEQEEEVTRDYRDLNYEEAWAEYERPNRRRGSIRSRSVTFLGGRARSVSPDTLWMAEDFWSRKPEASYDSPSSSKNSELFTRYGPRGVSGLRWREYGVRKRSSFPRSTRGESGESRPSSPESRISNNEEEDVSKLNVDEAKISINDVDPEKKLCEACQGINAERLAVGYKHLRLADLDASVRSCKFCEFLRHHFGTPRFPWSNRFQVVLSKLWADIIDVQSGESVKGRPLLYFTNEHDPGIQYDVPWRYRLTSTRSENSFKIAKSWLDECHAGKNEHNTKKRWRSRSILQTISRKARLGPKKLKPENPTRLIDIRPDGGKPGEVRLVQAQNRRRKYIALSYCWGKISNPTWTTTKSNMRERMRGLSLSELPPTLFDAISIANGLGVRYIWIDSLCIVQDDPDEWAQEGGRMAGIYRGSVVTVAISSSESALEGAFNKTSTSHLEEFSSLIRIDSKLSDGRCGQLYFYTSCDKGPRERYIQTGPLMQRGWVMQERLLSSRILHYTASQIVWQCDHCFKTEDGLDREGPASLGPGRDFPRDLDYRLSVGELTYLWYMSVVSTYSHKALTYGSDKLVAISAVAKALYSNHKNDYLAGLWRASLISGLLWYRAGPGSKSKEYRSPSWSWASQDSAIYYSIPEAEYVTHYVNECFGDVESVEFECEIIDAEVNIGGPNAFGTVTGGHIRLRAPVISARVLKTPFPQEGLYPRDSYEHELIFWDGFRPIVVPAHMDDDDELKTREVLCAYVGHRRALILAQSTPGVRSYTRIGFGETSEGTELYGTDVFAGLMATAPLGIVTII